MARPKRIGQKPKGVFARLEVSDMEVFKQIAAEQRRPLGNLAQVALMEFIEAYKASKPTNNGHEYKAPRVRAQQTT